MSHVLQCLCDCVLWSDMIDMACALNHEPSNSDRQALQLMLNGLEFTAETTESLQ